MRTGLNWLAGLLLLALAGSLSQAAPLVVSGVVRDSSQNILPAVKVVNRGGTARAVTNDNGEFTLTLPERPVGSIEFEKPGYANRQIPIPTDGKRVEVTLAPGQNNAGLVREIRKVSLSHSLMTVQQKEPALLKKPLTAEVYRQFVAKHGEEPAEDVLIRVYVPSGATRVKAVFLISEHGLGGSMMEHRMFREFGDRHGIALVGVLGDPIQRGIFPAETLESLLADMGARVKHPELAQAPVLTFGHSNGTGFSVLYAALRPERTLGWISYHSGGSWHLIFPGIENSPGLVMNGQKDPVFIHKQDDAVRDLRRDRNAPVSMLIHGEAAHWPDDREAMYACVLAYFEACIRARAPGGLGAQQKLKPVKISDGWLADTYDRKTGGMQNLRIAPYRDYTGERSTANWLLDETFARQWQRFSATGKIAEGKQ